VPPQTFAKKFYFTLGQLGLHKSNLRDFGMPRVIMSASESFPPPT
jgi:hypothetical protein